MRLNVQRVIVVTVIVMIRDYDRVSDLSRVVVTSGCGHISPCPTIRMIHPVHSLTIPLVPLMTW